VGSHDDVKGVAVKVRESLEREVEACLATQLPRVDLREVTVVGPVSSGTVRVVVDHPDGVDHGVCEQVTRALQSVGLNDRYGIEVWSPGPEPALRTREHYEQARGHHVALRVDEDGKKRSREGVLESVTPDGVRLETPSGVLEVPFTAIRRACDRDGGHKC
jgi:ribosome maturation factor RimP